MSVSSRGSTWHSNFYGDRTGKWYYYSKQAKEIRFWHPCSTLGVALLVLEIPLLMIWILWWVHTRTRTVELCAFFRWFAAQGSPWLAEISTAQAVRLWEKQKLVPSIRAGSCELERCPLGCEPHLALTNFSHISVCFCYFASALGCFGWAFRAIPRRSQSCRPWGWNKKRQKEAAEQKLKTGIKKIQCWNFFEIDQCSNVIMWMP